LNDSTAEAAYKKNTNLDLHNKNYRAIMLYAEIRFEKPELKTLLTNTGRAPRTFRTGCTLAPKQEKKESGVDNMIKNIK
jgi:hypothetical protein